MASVAEVEKTLRELVRRLDNAPVDGRSLPERRELVVKIRDLDVTFIAAFDGGSIKGLVQADPTGDEDVKISVGSDDLIALATGRLGVASAMLTGRLRVDAGVRDLLLIRQLF